jgi:hypothetical protein
LNDAVGVYDQIKEASEIGRLDARIDSVARELRTAIDVRERLAALEARCAS